MSFIRLAARSLTRPRVALTVPRTQTAIAWRAGYSAAAGLSRDVIQTRVLEVLGGFEKVKNGKVSVTSFFASMCPETEFAQLTPTASFAEDLGLDSLDAVEVVMAVEEEFAIEIPDAEADEIKTVQQAIDYIAKTPEVVDQPLLKIGCNLGEGEVFHLDTKTLQYTVEQFEEAVTCLALRKNGPGLACAAAQGIALLEGNSSFKYLCQPLQKAWAPYVRFNDGACDSKGRFFAGSVYSSALGIPGQLWRYDPADGTCVVVDEGPFTDSNGLGWSPDNKTLYFTDSKANIIYAYDYDSETGAISNRRVFTDALVQGQVIEGFADGLCIDSEGGVWSARWGGSCIVRYSSDGTIDAEIKFPTVYKVTACCFGGPNEDKLYVTTAHCDATNDTEFAEEKQREFPDSGHLFVVDLAGKYKGGKWRYSFSG
ncbi:hypothetical protein HWV62_37605 [Athelia sp. TMB]|nr:hypothetical protein HWV62_37605 [Athelia sp. TMB]